MAKHHKHRKLIADAGKHGVLKSLWMRVWNKGHASSSPFSSDIKRHGVVKAVLMHMSRVQLRWAFGLMFVIAVVGIVIGVELLSHVAIALVVEHCVRHVAAQFFG